MVMVRGTRRHAQHRVVSVRGRTSTGVARALAICWDCAQIVTELPRCGARASTRSWACRQFARVDRGEQRCRLHLGKR